MKPIIEYGVSYKEERVVISVNNGEDFYFEGESIPDKVWIELIKLLGFQVNGGTL